MDPLIQFQPLFALSPLQSLPITVINFASLCYGVRRSPRGGSQVTQPDPGMAQEPPFPLIFQFLFIYFLKKLYFCINSTMCRYSIDTDVVPNRIC